MDEPSSSSYLSANEPLLKSLPRLAAAVSVSRRERRRARRAERNVQLILTILCGISVLCMTTAIDVWKAHLRSSSSVPTPTSIVRFDSRDEIDALASSDEANGWQDFSLDWAVRLPIGKWAVTMPSASIAASVPFSMRLVTSEGELLDEVRSDVGSLVAMAAFIIVENGTTIVRPQIRSRVRGIPSVEAYVRGTEASVPRLFAVRPISDASFPRLFVVRPIWGVSVYGGLGSISNDFDYAFGSSEWITIKVFGFTPKHGAHLVTVSGVLAIDQAEGETNLRLLDRWGATMSEVDSACALGQSCEFRLSSPYATPQPDRRCEVRLQIAARSFVPSTTVRVNVRNARMHVVEIEV
jgi:hypothetical protein